MFRKSTPAKAGGRRAFTLVELLAVIAIIGVLAALTTAAVMRVRSKGKELEVRNDLTSLDTAIASFRAKMANTPIPNGGHGVPWTAGQHDMAGTFRLCTGYTDAAGNYLGGFTANDPEIAILKRMFPRMKLDDNGLRSGGNPIPATAPMLLDSNQCMVFFLSGGSFTEYTGFASDPFTPFAPPATSPKRLSNGAFFEFKPDRMIAPAAYTPREYTEYVSNGSKRFSSDSDTVGRQEKWFCDPWKNPYIYFSSTNGNDYQTTACTIAPWGGPYSHRATTTPPWNPTLAQTGVFPFRDSANKFLNPKTHQIISMGDDEVMGSGDTATSAYQAGSAEWLANAPGGNDFANFRGLRLGAAGAD